MVESELIIQVSRSLSLGFQLRFQCHHIVKNVHEFFVESQKILKCIDFKTDTLNIGYIMESYSSLIKLSLNDEILESEPQCESIDRNPRSLS